MRTTLLITCLLGLTTVGYCQQQWVIVESIFISGNKQTREATILREMIIEAGDTLNRAELDEKLEKSRNYILNTGLFNTVTIEVQSVRGAVKKRVTVLVVVEEQWYLYPAPIFELADPSFNVWWNEQGADLSRTNYGIDFSHTNFTGRGDRIKLGFQTGFTRDFDFSYSVPYINRKQTLGINTRVSFSQNREIAYATIDNKLKAYDNQEEKFTDSRFYAHIGFSYRKAIEDAHFVTVSYHQNWVVEEIARELNPHFFLNGDNLQRFFSLRYTFVHDNRDFRPYPTNGKRFVATLEKDGFGVFGDRSALTTSLAFQQFVPLTEKINFSYSVRGKYSFFRHRQPYNDNRAVGAGSNSIRGYEFYMIDGLDMGILKTGLRFPLFNHSFNLDKFVPIDAFKRLPIEAYFCLNADMGYVNNPFDSDFNSLDNQMLYGGGPALDLLFYTDILFRLEYNFNHLLENGLSLHFNMNI